MFDDPRGCKEELHKQDAADPGTIFTVVINKTVLEQQTNIILLGAWTVFTSAM